MRLDTSHDEGRTVTIAPDQQAVSALVANFVGDQIAANPRSLISLPTGSTPLVMFDILAARSGRGEIDFSDVSFFSLDDYLGLRPSDANSLSGWLERAFLSRVNLQATNVHLVPADDPSPVDAANAYDADLTLRGGFDLVVLGMGENGHVAFNEPGSEVTTRTRVVELTPETREQAAAYWDGQFHVPDRAMTVGIANILEARQIVLLVTGPTKAPILDRALTGDVSPRVPASLLRLAGRRLHVYADEDAASQLTAV